METFLIIFFACNIFIAGFFFGKNFDFIHTKKDLVIEILRAIAYIFAALALILVVLPLQFILLEIDKILQIRFFWSFYFTNEFTNIDKGKLDKLNEIVKKRTKNSLKNKIFRYCNKLLNERYNKEQKNKNP